VKISFANILRVGFIKETNIIEINEVTKISIISFFIFIKSLLIKFVAIIIYVIENKRPRWNITILFSAGLARWASLSPYARSIIVWDCKP
jgi:hypothetical protein